MRVVTYAEIMAAPAGSVFYSICSGNREPLGPCFKQTGEHDLYYCAIGPQLVYEGTVTEHSLRIAAQCSEEHSDEQQAILRGNHYALDSCGTREGLFDADNTYLLLEQKDIDYMIKQLRGTAGDPSGISAVPVVGLGE